MKEFKPFDGNYGYDNTSSFVSISKQKNAKYTTPQEVNDTAEFSDKVEGLYAQKFGTSPNIATVCGMDCDENDECGDSDVQDDTIE